MRISIAVFEQIWLLLLFSKLERTSKIKGPLLLHYLFNFLREVSKNTYKGFMAYLEKHKDTFTVTKLARIE